MTLLITSVQVDSLDELRVRAGQAWVGGADAVEIRIDGYHGDPTQLAEYLKANSDQTWIVTCRRAEEGGSFRGDTAERVSLLVAAARGTDAIIDFELADWRRSGNIRQKVRFAAERTDGRGHRLILSAHDPAGLPSNLKGLVDEMGSQQEVTTCKLAYNARRMHEGLHALDLMHELGGAVTAIAMGDRGLWTRVLAGKLGGFATYCALEEQLATAPGQITLDEMVKRYRWPEIDSATRVFGVVGDPVAHSMGPLVFNKWFAAAGLNAVYLPLCVEAEDNGLCRFLDGCAERPWLDIGGFSVTIPHKTEALRWPGANSDWMGVRIGAVNTLSFGGGKCGAYNTDCYAAVSSLAEALGCSRGGLGSLSADVLGAGGAARAIVYGLPMFGCNVTVYGRSLEKARRLAEEFNVRAAAWDDRLDGHGDVLINCTNVGMWPDTGMSPMPPESLGRYRLVFDLIYNPARTRLLKDAFSAGCQTLNGLDMFVRQAAMQFELWTGLRPDAQLARDLIMTEIERNAVGEV
jgi:3-dehydroquinate dehydratase/shikimate dehydrogenase